jgi:hypothetical protein
MPLQKTHEELLASNISPRNYSAVLPVIYNLKKTANKNYVPEAVKTVAYSAGVVGDGAQKTFDAISAVYNKGDSIILTGTATYALTGGASPIIKPAINIIAQIDMNLQNVDKSLIPYQVYAKASEINSSGQFSFAIPPSITQLLSLGAHYVYIDASSPDNAPVRLVASGTPTDPNNKLYYTRTFNIGPIAAQACSIYDILSGDIGSLPSAYNSGGGTSTGDYISTLTVTSGATTIFTNNVAGSSSYLDQTSVGMYNMTAGTTYNVAYTTGAYAQGVAAYMQDSSGSWIRIGGSSTSSTSGTLSIAVPSGISGTKRLIFRCFYNSSGNNASWSSVTAIGSYGQRKDFRICVS